MFAFIIAVMLQGTAEKETFKQLLFFQNWYLLQESWNKINSGFLWFIQCRCAVH